MDHPLNAPAAVPMGSEAIILVGGRGTRLGAVTAHTPKPLLEIAGRPFLCHVLDYLVGQGVTRVILATGHLAGAFERTLGPEYRGITLVYSQEHEPLGTGGAVAQALHRSRGPDVMVLNGDTYFPADLTALRAVHATASAYLSLILRQVPDVSRYGHLTVSGNLVTSLSEKGAAGPGLINGGIYLINRAAFLADAPNGPFSLERDLLPCWVERRAVACTLADAYFIDIGIPADLERAQRELNRRAPQT